MKPTWIAIVIGALLLAAPAQADGPDYDNVLILIRNGLKGSFAEQKRCVFRAPGGEFHAGSLDVVASAITASEVHFDCRKQQQCVTPEKGQSTSTIKFAVHGNALGLAGELSRLVEMCSGGGH
jgi:hypothetical protein